jgi:hypothetical protein
MVGEKTRHVAGQIDGEMQKEEKSVDGRGARV